jgi:hypothetical protein
MGLVSIVTTVIAFAVVALRILTRKYVVKMPLRVDDCEFRWTHLCVDSWLIINIPDFAVASVTASILLVISNAIRMRAASYICWCCHS